MKKSDRRDRLANAIALAKAGNAELAQAQLGLTASESFNDPAFWIWLGWLAESPSSMERLLERALELDPSCAIAKLGLKWARAIGNFELDSTTETPPESKAESLSDSRAFTINLRKQSESQAHKRRAPIRRFVREERSTVAQQSAAAAAVKPFTDEEGNGFGIMLKALQNAREHFRSSNWEAPATEPSKPRTEAPRRDPSEKSSSESPRRIPLTVRTTSKSKNPPDSAAPAEEEAPPAVEPESEAVSTDVGVENESTPSASAVDASPVEDTPRAEAPDVEERLDVEADILAETVNDDADDPIAARSANNTGPKVLVVDDSPTVRKLVTLTLSQQNFRTSIAEDGVEALRQLTLIEPDVVIMDIEMPRLDGYKLCKLIKANKATRHIRVIMLSGEDGVFVKVRGRMVGCTTFIHKPLSPPKILAAVETVLSKNGPKPNGEKPPATESEN